MFGGMSVCVQEVFARIFQASVLCSRGPACVQDVTHCYTSHIATRHTLCSRGHACVQDVTNSCLCAGRHALLHVTHCVVGGMPVCRTSQIPACVQDVTNSCLCAGRHKFLPECRTSQIPACVQDVTNSCLCAGRHKFQLILLQISSRTAL
jgi:hypothetical protein